MSQLIEATKARNYKTMGAYIKRHREALSLSQSYVSEKCGMKYSAQLSQIERGFVTVPPKYWKTLCAVLQLDAADFYSRALSVGYSDLYKALYSSRPRREVVEHLSLILNDKRKH